MVATLYLMGCVLAAGQTGGPPAAPLRGDWLLAPRLSRSQELVYRGTFAEEARGTRVEFSRAYHVEARAFVLDTPPRGADVAFLTVLKHRGPQPAAPPAGPSSARVARLIGQLGDDDFLVREAAAKALNTIGDPAHEALRKAARDNHDLEVRWRAERIVQTIEGRWRIRRITGRMDPRFKEATEPYYSVAFSPP